jgi:hypothetical protein
LNVNRRNWPSQIGPSGHASSDLRVSGVHGSLQAPLAGGGFTLRIALVAAGYARDKYAELLRWRRRPAGSSGLTSRQRTVF